MEDGEAQIAHLALQWLHILPGQFNALPDADRAFVIASIQTEASRRKKEAEH